MSAETKDLLGPVINGLERSKPIEKSANACLLLELPIWQQYHFCLGAWPKDTFQIVIIDLRNMAHYDKIY